MKARDCPIVRATINTGVHFTAIAAGIGGLGLLIGDMAAITAAVMFGSIAIPLTIIGLLFLWAMRRA